MKAPTKNKSRYIWLFTTAILIAVGVFLLQGVGYFSIYNTQLQDRLMDTRPASSDIVIVSIDEDDVQVYGSWPFPRNVHADMIDVLTDAGVKAIGYDVTFSEAKTEEEDAALEQAIQDSGKVVLSQELTLVKGQTGHYDVSGYLIPLGRFFKAGAESGYTNIFQDGDGYVRRVPIIESYQSETELNLGRKLFASEIANIPESSEFYHQSISDLGIEYKIPFVGPLGSYVTYSFADVINGDVPANRFENKFVLVGSFLPDLHDAYLTPSSKGELMAGVEIQANILQGILDGKNNNTPYLIRVASDLASFEIYLALAILLTILLLLVPLRFSPFIFIGTFIGYLLVALAFASIGWLLPVVYPVLVIVGVSVVDIGHRYLSEHRKRRWVQGAFGYYLAPQVVDRLVAGETALAPGGVKEELTILFSDIRGFTSISEKLDPESLVKLLNEYLSEMTDIILETDGVLDKYIGDAVMAFWGAPLPQEDHAKRAAKSALLMKSKLRELNVKWEEQGRPEFKIGIGINTGDVVVGNMGSKKRFDYTVIGDAVNLGARLEGLTKQYGAMILISESTKNKIGADFVVREIDRVAVKGKNEPVTIFELVGLKDEVEEKVLNLVSDFEKGLALYRARDWVGAKREFESLVKDHDDGPSKLFAERCDQMEENDPGHDWGGVYVATSK